MDGSPAGQRRAYRDGPGQRQRKWIAYDRRRQPVYRVPRPHWEAAADEDRAVRRSVRATSLDYDHADNPWILGVVIIQRQADPDWRQWNEQSDGSSGVRSR